MSSSELPRFIRLETRPSSLLSLIIQFSHKCPPNTFELISVETSKGKCFKNLRLFILWKIYGGRLRKGGNLKGGEKLAASHWKWDKLRRNNGCDLGNFNMKNQEKRASFGRFYLKRKSCDTIPKTWEIINENIFRGKKYFFPLDYQRRNAPMAVSRVEMEIGRIILILAFSITRDASICYQISEYPLPNSLSFPHGIHSIGFRRCSLKAISRHRISLSARHSQPKSEW